MACSCKADVDIELSEDMLKQVLDSFAETDHLAYKIIGEIRAKLRKSMNRKFVVNKWPDYSVLIGIPQPNKNLEFLDNVYSIYAKNSEDLQGFLMNTRMIDWHRNVVIAGVSLSFKNVLQEVCSLKECKMTGSESPTKQYTLCDIANLRVRDIPDGYTISKLTREDAEQVDGEWKHTMAGSMDYIRFLIKNFHSVKLCDKEGDVVGYYLQQWYGALGMLHVVENQRGRGLSKLLVGELAKIVGESGEPVYCYVEDGNDVSAKLHESAGFQEDSGTGITWISIVPNNSSCCGSSSKCCV